MRACAEMLADEKMAGGIPAAEARRRALAELGGAEQIKAGGARRAGRNRPGAIVAGRTVWIAATAPFAGIRCDGAVDHHDGPGRDDSDVQHRVCGDSEASALCATGPAGCGRSQTLAVLQPANDGGLAERQPGLKSIAAYTGWSPRIESSAGVGHVNAALVSQNFMGTLGVPLRLGQDFTQSGNERDCFGQAIVTEGYWRRMGGGNALDRRTIRLDYQTYIIIGVLAPSAALEDMDALGQPSILTPIGCDPAKHTDSRGDSSFQGIARLKPGVSMTAALEDLTMTQKNLSRAYPRYYPPAFAPTMTPLSDFISGTRSVLLATLTACGMLLLISCANLTNLLLARSTRRRSEFALRTMLGARPLRLFRQMLTENATLVALGSGLGMVLASVLVHLASRSRVVNLPRLNEAHIDFRAVVFAGAVSATIAILLTLLPAARSRRIELAEDLRSGSSGSSSAPQGLRQAGRLLVAAQIAMAFVLVAASGWMVSSVAMLLHQPLGFDPDHLLFASTDLRGPVRSATDRSGGDTRETARDDDGVRRIPGVEEVAAANDKPLGGRVNQYDFCSDVHPDDCRRIKREAPDVFLVTPNYFRTVGQTLLRGRAFNNADDGRNHVVIVNRALAQHEWPGENPIGHRIFLGRSECVGNGRGRSG